MKTVAEYQKEFECSECEASLLLVIARRGHDHGSRGWYLDGEFASDADWVYGVGDLIQELETRLNDEDGAVFRIYEDAHADALSALVATFSTVNAS